eukprot:TRINITY_DN4324_c0_g4_i1.p2 TRINITY_DN4324_c0_g4~~TRINITY_DN4324_c0_g4_i1.p2  ORF type:complete len:219 (+),score=50.09 TRINITY_DN4324_c0_g4_i1:89-745(+)
MPPKAAAPKPAAKAAAPAAKPAAKAAAPAAKPAAKAAAKAAPAAKPAAKAAAPAPAVKAAAGNGVYVRGLGDAGVDAVKAIFAPAGNVADVRLRRNKFAIVFFEATASVKKAIDAFNGKDIKGHPVTVVSAKSAPKPAKSGANATTVFVSPLFRQNTTRAQIRGIFEGCGKITKLRTYRNNFAFVTFDSAANAAKAIKEKNGATFRNKKLLVKASIRK